MAILSQVLKLDLAPVKIVFVGIPEVTSYVSKEKNEPYYACRLQTPVKVRCSVDANIMAIEYPELFIRESDLNEDKWKFVDEAKPELGFWIEGWVADFSVNQQIPIYQETTIAEWGRENRGLRKVRRTAEINAGLMERLKNASANKG